nr:hypothetical protein [Tanacetum cinerariifolium]
MGSKKKTVVVTSDPLALIAEKTNVSRIKEKVVVSSNSEGSEADDFSELKKITALLEKAFNQRKFYSKPTNKNLRTSSTSQSANKKQEFIKTDNKKVEKKDDEKNSSSADEKIYEVSYYLSESESESEFETSEYYDNSTNYGLFVNNDDDQEIFHDAIESASENLIENHIDSQKDYDKCDVDHNDFEEKDHFVDKLIRKFNKKIVKCQKRIEKANQQNKDFENQNKDLQDKYDVLKNQATTLEMNNKELNEQLKELHKMGQTNQNVHMIMPSKDNLYNGRKEIGFENPNYFEKAKDLRPTLYDENVIGLGYTPMFLTHSDEALEIEKFKRSRENKIEYAYDYGNLNASYVNEKINFEDDYFQVIINPDFDKIDSPFQQKSSLKPYVPNVILEKIIIDLEDEVVSLLEKEKANLETIESLKSKGFESSENVSSESENQSENDCLVVEKECYKEENPKVIAPGMFKLSVSQSVSPISMSKSSCESNNVEIKLKRKRLLERTKNSGVIWKKRRSSNTFNVDLSAVSVSKLNKNVKRYFRKDLLSCNNSHLGETRSAYVCNDAMKVSCCDSKMNDLLDDNNFFIFDDESVKISHVSKMPFRKKPRDSINVHSKSNSNKSLPRTVHKWLLKMQPLAEPVAKWFPRVKRCSKHMTGNRALLTNFVEKFLGTVRFGNNDFAVIAGYGDVVIDGVDLLIGDRSSNLYTIALNEVASNSSTCLLAKASSSQSWLWHQRLSHLNFATINNLVTNNLV